QAPGIEIEADLIPQSEFVHTLQHGNHLKVAMPGVNVGFRAVDLGKLDLRWDQAAVLGVTREADVDSPHAHAIVALSQRAHVPRQRKGNARRQAATLRADDRADEVDRRIAEYLARSNSRGAVINFEGWPTLKHASGIEHDGIAAKQQGLLRFSRRIDDCRGAAAEDF